MNSTLAKALFVGIPLIISLAWFVFWVVKLTRTARKLRKRSGPGSETPRT